MMSKLRTSFRRGASSLRQAPRHQRHGPRSTRTADDLARRGGSVGGVHLPSSSSAWLASRPAACQGAPLAQWRLACSATTEAEVDENQLLLNRLDIRAGKILSVAEHEEADSLFVESIDVGDEEGPRTIVSGLKPSMAASDLEGKMCVVLCNLKPRNMRGVKSHGMVLCASDKKVEGEEKVELLSPRDGTPAGERLCFGAFVAGEDMQEPDGPNKIQKKNIWEKVSEDLKTDADGGAAWGDLPMVSSAGQVTSATLKNANIS